MVSGGPYGMEDILGGAGYGWAIVILLVLPTHLEPAHRAHDRRTRRRHSRRRRLLRLGAPRASARSGATRKAGSRSRPASLTWRSTPPSSSSILANSALRSPPAARLSLVARCRRPLLSRGTCAARPASATTPSGCPLLLLAPFVVFVALGFWRGLTLHPAIKWGRSAHRSRCRHRPLHRNPRRPLELHGLGQRLHRRARRRESPAQLSARHHRRHRPHRRYLRSAARRHGRRRPLASRLLHRFVGHCRRQHSADPCCRWPSSPVASSAASACSTHS